MTWAPASPASPTWHLSVPYLGGPESGTLATCSREEAALLRLEEVLSATLARINSLILQPLLSTGESRLSMGRVRDVGWPPVTRGLPCCTL